MKFSDIKSMAEKLAAIKNININDVDFCVSLDPIEIRPDYHKRYFGEIVDLEITKEGIIFLCEGELNKT